MKARKFVHPSREIIAMPDTSGLKPPFEPDKVSRIFTPGPGDKYARTAERRPRFGDFDYNRHMNNARYADWIQDEFYDSLMPEERARNPHFSSLEIVFRAEIGAEDPEKLLLTSFFDRDNESFTVRGASTGPDGAETTHFESRGKISFEDAGPETGTEN